MADKKIIEFKLEVSKLEQVITDLQKNIQTEVEKKREINAKKIDLIKQGGQKDKVIELNKELLEINANVLFYTEEIEIMREHIEEVKQEKVMELIDYRLEVYKELQSKRSELEKELQRLKVEYLRQVHHIAGLEMSDIRAELGDLNDVIRTYGNGSRMSQPRLLMPLEIQEFSVPRPVDPESPFVLLHELQKAIRG